MNPESSLSSYRMKAILTLALPIIAGMGSQNILNLVDTAMVGRLGTVSLAAVGIASIAIWVMTSIIQGISPAVQAITARRLGEKSTTRLHEAIVNAMYLVVILGIPYSLILLYLSPHMFDLLTTNPEVAQVGREYLNIRLYTVVIVGLNFCFRGYFNGRKMSILYMQTLLLMHPINILLNYLLIFGKFGFPALEARGAALGTAIATTLGTLNYIRLLIKYKNPGFSLKPSGISRKILVSLLKIAVPSCTQTLTLSMGFLVFFRIAEMISTEALAATNVLVNLSLVCILISMGLGLATITLVGNAIGEGNPGEAKQWVKGVLFIGCTTMGLIGCVLALWPRIWLGIFMVDPDTIEIAALPLILLGLSQSFDAAGLILTHAHLGGGDSKSVMWISIVNQWLFFLPLCFIWVYFFDGQLLHIWIGMVLYRLLLFLSFAWSYRSGRWLTLTI